MKRTEKIANDFHNTGIAVWDNFISGADASILRAELEKRKAFMQKAGVGRGSDLQIKKDVRGDFIEWIQDSDDSDFRKIYLNPLWEIVEEFNKRFFLGIRKSEHHLAWYPPGTRYQKHVDVFKSNDARVVSTVLYLNSSWQPSDGGELCIYPPTISQPLLGRAGPEKAAPLKVEPVGGRLVLFESTLEHEVLESNASRYSVTGWFKRKPPL